MSTKKGDTTGTKDQIGVMATTNVSENPDLVWTLLNGQGRVRKAPNEAYDTPEPGYNGLSNVDESQCFYGNPSQYDWNYITKKEMLIAYNNNHLHNMQATDYIGPDFSSAKLTRWEKHRVWVVEATLHPGNHNVLSKRRFYIDEDTGQAVLGEAYDADGNLAKCYFCPTRCSPTVPKVNPLCIVTYNLLTGDYLVQGQLAYGTYLATEYSAPQPETNFEAQQMAANASF